MVEIVSSPRNKTFIEVCSLSTQNLPFNISHSSSQRSHQFQFHPRQFKNTTSTTNNTNNNSISSCSCHNVSCSNCNCSNSSGSSGNSNSNNNSYYCPSINSYSSINKTEIYNSIYNSYDSASDVTYAVKINSPSLHGERSSRTKNPRNCDRNELVNHYYNLDDNSEDDEATAIENDHYSQKCLYLRTKLVIQIPPPEIKSFEQWRKRQKERRLKKERNKRAMKRKQKIAVVELKNVQNSSNNSRNDNKSRLLCVNLKNNNSNEEDENEDDEDHDSGDEIEEQEVSAFVREFPCKLKS